MHLWRLTEETQGPTELLGNPREAQGDRSLRQGSPPRAKPNATPSSAAQSDLDRANRVEQQARRERTKLEREQRGGC